MFLNTVSIPLLVCFHWFLSMLSCLFICLIIFLCIWNLFCWNNLKLRLIISSSRVDFPYTSSIRPLEVLAIQDYFFCFSAIVIFFSYLYDLKLSCGLYNECHTSNPPFHLVQPFNISTQNMGILPQALPLIVLDSNIFNPSVLQQCQKYYSDSHPLLLDHQLYPAPKWHVPRSQPSNSSLLC